MLFFNRVFPENIIQYGGSQWWMLPMETNKLIYSFLNENRDYIEYHEDTQVPDEIFFHSIIHSKISNKLISFNITYVKWPKGEIPSPITFTINDLEGLKNSGALFVRKFDMYVCNHIVDKLDLQG